MFVYIHCRADEKKFSARMMCAVLPVSESGFYKWKRNRKKVKAWQKLLAQMHEILEEDEENKNYGVRRMQIALEQRGIKRSLSTVRRVMARGNLLHEDRRSQGFRIINSFKKNSSSHGIKDGKMFLGWKK